MLRKHYNNFVKASVSSEIDTIQPALSGEQAKEIYLNEIKDANSCTSSRHASASTTPKNTTQRVKSLEDIPCKDLFKSVQNNDVNMLKVILDSCPSLINMVDNYGWSLLMIACQANSVDTVKELLKRGVDTSVRDKGGNSATNLVIRNKNLELVDLLIHHRNNNSNSNNHETSGKINIPMLKETFVCEICNKAFPDKEEHLTSTVHNISTSKDRKIPTNYVIPQTNKGYQLMLKVGWDRECGLGRDGRGKKYPIKAIPKKDRKGLGHKKTILEDLSQLKACKRNELVNTKLKNDKSIEIHFRREFY